MKSIIILLFSTLITFLSTFAYADYTDEAAQGFEERCHKKLELVTSKYSADTSYYREKDGYKKTQNCQLAGKYYYHQKRNYSKAFDLFKRACDGIDSKRRKHQFFQPISCSYVAEMYYEGEGISKNHDKAFDMVENTCPEIATSRLFNCGLLAKIYEEGKVVKKDLYKSAQFLKRDCIFGENITSCKRSFELATQLCSNKNPKACILVSDLYHEVNAKYFDPRNADNGPKLRAKHLEMACSLNDSSSCAKVAGNYMSEEGVKQNYAKAITFLKKACEGSPSLMCSPLSSLYLDGQHTKKNIKAANKYASIGCKNGEGHSCGILGIQYANGEGVAQSFKEALKYLKRGCESGSSGSCGIVSNMYLNGQGTGVDRSMALAYFIVQCKTDGRYRKQDCEGLTDKDLPKSK